MRLSLSPRLRNEGYSVSLMLVLMLVLMVAFMLILVMFSPFAFPFHPGLRPLYVICPVKSHGI